MKDLVSAQRHKPNICPAAIDLVTELRSSRIGHQMGKGEEVPAQGEDFTGSLRAKGQ